MSELGEREREHRELWRAAVEWANNDEDGKLWVFGAKVLQVPPEGARVRGGLGF